MFSGFHMERAKTDIKYFLEWLGYNWGDHIEDWLKVYEERGGAEVHRVCIIAPRGHSKSTTLRIKLLHLCLFERFRNKPFTAWLFSASKDAAARRLEEVREDLKRHPQLRNMIDERRGNRHELRLTNGSWIKATGIGAAIRGEHPACIALDDILADLGDLNMKTVTEWFRKVITPMLDPGTSLYCVGTPMSLTDLYHTEMLEKKVWKSGTWSAIPNWDAVRAGDEEDYECLWPEERPLKYLLEQKEVMGELSFTQEFLCKVVDDDSAVFKRAHIRKNLDMEGSLEWEKNHHQRYVIGFDPSQGIGQDYTVMVVLRQDENGELHFCNMWRQNDFLPDKQCLAIGEWLQRYNNPVFACEEVGFQRLYETLLARLKIPVDFRGSKVSNRVLKQALLNRVRVWFEQGKIHFPYKDHETRKVVELVLEELESHVWKDGEITDVGRHNDCVMALAHAIDQFDTSLSTVQVFGGAVEKNAFIGGKKQTRVTRKGGKYSGFRL